MVKGAFHPLATRAQTLKFKGNWYLERGYRGTDDRRTCPESIKLSSLAFFCRRWGITHHRNTVLSTLVVVKEGGKLNARSNQWAIFNALDSLSSMLLVSGLGERLIHLVFSIL